MFLKYKIYHDGDQYYNWELAELKGVCFHPNEHFCFIELGGSFESLYGDIDEYRYKKLVEEIAENIPNGIYEINDIVFLGGNGHSLANVEAIKAVFKKMHNKFLGER